MHMNELSSDSFFNLHKFEFVGKNVVWVSNSLDPDEMLSYPRSHRDPSHLHKVLHTEINRLRINDSQCIKFESRFLG